MMRVRGGLSTFRSNFRVEWIVWIVAVAILIWLVAYPVGMLLLGSFRSGPPGVPSDFTLENHKVFLDPQYWQAVGKSLLVSLGATVMAVLMGVPLAWFVARTNTPFARLLEGLSLGTFLFTPLMGVVAWILLASPKIGLLNVAAVALLGRPIFNIYSFAGYMWVLGIYYSPYPFLIVSGVLKSVDPTLEEAARASGAGIWRTTWKITFPLALPGILASAILVSILSLGNFAIQAALGQGSRLQVLTYTIFRKVTNFPSDYAGATAAAFALLAISFVLTLVYQRVMKSGRRFETVTGKGYRAGRIDLGKWKYVGTVFCLLYVIVGWIGPLAVLFYESIVEVGPQTVFGLGNYINVINIRMFSRALSNSLIVAGFGATSATALAVILTYIVYRTPVRGRQLLDYTVMLALSVPGVVMSMAMIWAYVGFPIRIYGTLLLLILAYNGRFISYAVRSVGANLVQLHKELEESARVHGASWATTVGRILLPLLKPGIASGWAMLFIVFMRELSIVVLIWTSRTVTLPVLGWELYNWWSYNEFAALGMIHVALVYTCILIFRKFLGADISRQAA